MQNAGGVIKNNTGAVIVAAGMSSRMGDFKPMLEIGGASAVMRVITNFKRAAVFPIVLVTGYRARELEKHVSKLNVLCVRNENYMDTEMVDSAKIGLSYISDKCSRTFFTPVDVPLFTADTVKKLAASQAEIARPTWCGKVGHPALISNRILTDIIDEASISLKGALKKFENKTDWVEVEDKGVTIDVDTPQDLDDAIKFHNSRMLRPEVEVSLCREQKIFDKTLALLLRVIEFDGTVKGACKKTGISYSKAWNLISMYEGNIGFKLVERSPGGEAGGASCLTFEGRKLLRAYEEYVKRVSEFADKCLPEFFEDGINSYEGN